MTFFSLLVVLVAEAVKSSPCMRKVGRNRRFGARWESFVPGGPPSRACWESSVPGGPASRAAGRVLYRVGLPRPLAGRVLYRKRPRMRDKVLPARVVGGGSGKKFSLHAKGGPKSAFWGSLGEFCTGWACQGRLLGEFCTGWAAEPGSRASFVSLKARCGLHRAFLAPIAPPIDAAVMRCRYAWARWPCPTGQREPHPGSVGYAFVAPRKPPAHASCAGGRQRKHQQATQAVQTT